MKIILLLNIIFLFKTNGFPTIKEKSLKENNPEENVNLIEGDILLPYSPKTSRGVLLRGNTVAWTNGIVPYIISSGYGFSQRSFIISTMRKMERLIAINNIACIQFREKIPSDEYYITIRNGYGCSSYVGQNTGIIMERTVTLQHPGCLYEAIIMHEFLHTLGFFHEQSRPDRDNYIQVNYENILEGMEYNFDKYNNSYVNTLNTSYDYLSVMHYDRYAFSSNGLSTIEPLESNITIGQRYNMSRIDIEEVRLFYNCSSIGSTLPPIDTNTTDILYNINKTISSSLTTNSEIYIRYGSSNGNYYYYESYELNISSSSSGYFIFQSNSTIDTYGYLYSEYFNVNNPYLNLITYDDDSGGNRQFQFEINLISNRSYIIVFTTFSSFIIGNYDLIIYSSIPFNINKLNISSNISTPITMESTTINRLTSTYPPIISSSSREWNINIILLLLLLFGYFNY